MKKSIFLLLFTTQLIFSAQPVPSIFDCIRKNSTVFSFNKCCNNNNISLNKTSLKKQFNKAGQNPLQAAIMYNKKKLATFFMKKGFTCEPTDIFLIAFASNSIAQFEAWCQLCNLDINAMKTVVDFNGTNLLHYAYKMINRKPWLFDYLIARGFAPQDATLFNAARDSLAQFKIVYNAYYNSGKDPKVVVNNFDSNLASFAALVGNVPVLEFLINKGISIAPDTVNKNGYNALANAASMAQADTIKVLLAQPPYRPLPRSARNKALNLAQTYYHAVKNSGRTNLIQRAQASIDALKSAS